MGEGSETSQRALRRRRRQLGDRPMATLTEGRHPGEFIINEDPGTRSREAVSVGATQTIEANSLLAKLAVVGDVVATPSAAATNTASSGTIAMGTPAVSAKVK